MNLLKVTNMDVIRIAARSGVALSTVRRAIGGKVKPYKLTQESILDSLNVFGFEALATQLEKEWKRK